MRGLLCALMKHVKFSLLATLVLYFNLAGFAQTGGLKGKIIDEVSGEDLVGAVLQIESLGLGAASDLFGEYSLNKIPAGKYLVTVSYISYQTKTIKDVEIIAGETRELNVTLSSAPIETGTVEIVDFRTTNSEAAVLMEMKEAKGVISGIGAAQIAKSQDRDASEVARRIPGVTVVDNRFVIIRGLSERYNAVMINNAFAPSMETDVRSFSFDIVSSGLIDRFLIYKSPSADLPGEFAGGAVKIYTRNFPAKKFEITYNQTFGFRQGTSLQDFYYSNRSKTDWLGFDSGDRALPSGFPSNVRDTEDDERLRVSQSLSNNIEQNTEKAPLDWRSSLSIGRKWEKEFGEFGLIAAVNYSRTRTFFENRSGVYNVYDTFLNQSDTVSYMRDSTYQTNARVGGLVNFGFRNKYHSIELKLFGTQMGQSEDLFRRGVEQEQGNYVKSNFYNYNQRFITSNQLTGKHTVLNKKGNLEWTAGYASASSDDPDWRRVRYTKPLDNSNPDYQAYIPFSADPNYFGRLFMSMKESSRVITASYEHKLFSLEKNKDEDQNMISVKTGFYLENKERDFSVRNIGYKAAGFQTFSNTELSYKPIDQILNPENINLTNGIILDEDTKPQDSYEATNTLRSAFVMTSIPYKKWNLTGGLRLEKNEQALLTRDLQDKSYDIRLDSTVLLPSGLISYSFNEKSLIRAAYGKTVNRPEFRELAPFAFYDYKRNAIMNGNPDLTIASIDNYDVRWEIYPGAGEMFSLGAFYKNFIHPIELYFQPGVGSGGTLSFIPGNAPRATNYGGEIDMRLNAGNIWNRIAGKGVEGPTNHLHNFTLVANLSYIVSKIQVSESDAESGISSTRPMMGQSPYIVNTGIFYQNDSIGLSISAMYNRIGERVVVVGVPGIPEVWEMPRDLVDLTITKSIGEHFELRFGIQDILNQKISWLQDANEDGKLSRESDQSIQEFRRGSYYTFGLTYRFTTK